MRLIFQTMNVRLKRKKIVTVSFQIVLISSLLLVLFPCEIDAKGMVGKVEGVVGHQVTIPCDITPPTPGDSPHLVLWYKNIFGTPIYSVDLRNGLESASHWKDEKVLGKNVEFSLKKEAEDKLLMAYLSINKTKHSDAGPYRCRVDFWKAATRNFKVFVSLATEVDAVNIYNDKGKLISGKVVSSRVNGSIALSCKSFGGHPLPTLVWEMKGANKIQVNETSTEGDVVVSKLEMHGLQTEDSGRRLSCLAPNNNLLPAPRAEVTVEIILAPVRVEISRTISTFVSGTTYNLTCQVLGSNPIPSTAIWVGGQEMKNVYQRESSDGKIFTIVAQFTPNPKHDNTFVVCRAFNKFFPQEALEDQWKINVVYAPIANIHLSYPTGVNTEASLLHVKENDRVVLTCNSTANPSPYEYHWRHNGETRRLDHSGPSAQMILYEAEKGDAGNYTCLAENSQGLGVSGVFSVEVLFPPSCKNRTEGAVYMSVHESVDLACEMEANPANLTFRWKLETTDVTTTTDGENEGEINEEMVKGYLDVPSSQFTQHGSKSVLTLTPRTPADFGRVTCMATNRLGMGKSCTFMVNKKVVLPGVRNCEVTTTDAVLVVCEPLHQQSQINDQDFEFIAELVDNELGSSYRLTSTLPTFRFASVRPGATYTLNIYSLSDAANADKRLKFSQTFISASTDETRRTGDVTGGGRSVPQPAEPATTYSILNDDAMMERILPLLGVSGILIFAFIIIMIAISIARRSSDMLKDKTLHTHIAFNRCLDQDYGPDVLHQMRPGLNKVHSLDQLNQVSFQGFGSDSLAGSLAPSKYHTLPIGSVSVVSVLHHHNTNTTTSSSASDANIVKRVTFAKDAGSNSSSTGDSSNDSVRTIRDNSDYMTMAGTDLPPYPYEESSLI